MILISNEVGSKELSSLFHSTGIPCQLAELPSADFAFAGNGPDEEMVSIGIERKVVSDFLASFVSGRMMGEQLPRLCEQHHYPYLLLEGDIRPALDGSLETWTKGAWRRPSGKPWTYETIDHILTTITTHFPIRLLRTSNDRHTVIKTVSLYRYFCVPWASHGSYKVFHTPPPPVILACRPSEKDSDEDWQRWVCRLLVKELPGIGWIRSGVVADEFKTARRMLMGSRVNWQNIEGVGPKTATRVIRALGGG